MNLLVPVYVRTSNFVRDRVEMTKDRLSREEGIESIEWAAMAVLIVVIIIALMNSKIGDSLGTHIKASLNQIFKQDNDVSYTGGDG